MSKYIIKINPAITAFEIQSCETPITFTYEIQNYTALLEGIKAGDAFFVCYDSDVLKVKMLLEVIEPIDNKAIKLKKVIEVCSGADIFNPETILALKANDIVAISDSEGKALLKEILTCMDEANMFEDDASVLKKEVTFHTGYESNHARNRILFGAPGTGKSFTLNKEKDVLLSNGGEYERVTFHPDYSYANFVGTYKPVPLGDAITYAYVPGPFMRTYVKALKNSRTSTPLPFLLLIEEINRANVAAVFGDVFQLLDRDENNVSEYAIQATEDMKTYLATQLGGSPEDYAEIRIPDNMFIWATMNSADQGVFPMDTAFKRRWDFKYLGINGSEDGIAGKKVILGQGEYRRIVEWNALRRTINEELLEYKVNEDKLMGPYFISKKYLPQDEIIDPVEFTRIFKNKVLMYLFDDAAKQKRASLFSGCDEKSKNLYSMICNEFDIKGVYIFCENIRKKFIEIPEDNA